MADPCNGGESCQMKNLHNPLTCELAMGNVFMCCRCFRMHICDMRHDCQIYNTQEGYVCGKTGFVYDSMMPSLSARLKESDAEPSSDSFNVVSVILSYVYSYLINNCNYYYDIISSVIEDDKFKKEVEDSIFFTFNRVFQNSNYRVPLPIISKLFIQLIIGMYAKETKYDADIIKVSRRKKEDNILKRMRLEYGNALAGRNHVQP
ncbi:protein U63 [Suid betaherpesvirus 2]|uniref:Protein U63 n=1 Tax=Suid betaherpesvirus 2 TaxID=1608255 RepID=U3GQ30_9BETA|nr:protein U63 [Suid betaherpesvirus 2]AGT99255.1 protein U63 [Suid betaherpesvirus 2]